MSAPFTGSSIENRWPEPLRRFAADDELQFRSNGPHLYVWIAGPLALVLVLCGIAAISGIVDVTHGAVRVVTSFAALAFGTAVLTSCAYSIRGSMDLRRDGDTWLVVTRLGRWARKRRFLASDVRHVETYDPGPDIPWPGSCGPQLRVHLRHTERPIAVAAGLSLDDDVLESLKQLLAPKQEPDAR